jgi:hypothetical protein
VDANHILFRLWLRPTEWDTPDLYQLVAIGPQIDTQSLAADHAKLAQFIREVSERKRLTINVEWVSEYKYEFTLSSGHRTLS